VADRPSSFVLECAVYHTLAAHPANFGGALDQAFAALLNALYAWDFGRGGFMSWGQPAVADPAMPDTNVAERWGESAADRFKEKLGMALRRLEDIQRSRWDDTEVRHWGELFGGAFPAPFTVDRRVRQQSVRASK